MAEFKIDLAGRIRNFSFPKNEPLVPLFEAIINSINAIEERQKSVDFEGCIDVEVERSPQIVIESADIDYYSVADVIGFRITDNGIGLDDNNMKSFMQSDSSYKIEFGGKGVGRFSWLKAFEKAKVESVYKDCEGVPVRREFTFSLDEKEIDDSLKEVESFKDNMTTVSLINYKKEYKKHLIKTPSVLANRIMQHCVKYLMSGSCPRIRLIDHDGTICINDLFAEKAKQGNGHYEFTVLEQQFELLSIEMQDSTFGGSKLYLCANERVVREVDLEKMMVDLDRKLFQEEGFFYVGIVSGSYLDENVNSSRTGFEIPDEADSTELAIDKILSAAEEKVEEYLSEYLSDIREQKDERIRTYIKTSAPQYRHLIKYRGEDIKGIKPNLSEVKLDEELYRISRKFDQDLKKENEEILKRIETGAQGLSTYQEKFSEQIEKISDANKSALAQYVAHRKIIIELLQKGIQWDDSDRYEKESYIHNLVFPMRKTADEIDYEAHNLWLIDERLAYSDYISSDVPFDNNPKESRTDLLILDKPVAVSDENNEGKEFGSIIIFELKRPQRDDYHAGDNPIQQLLRYLDKLSSNTVKDKNGRTIRVGNNTQFYLYAVCDITPKLRELAETYDFVETPDKMGMFRYHTSKHAYIEIISFDKLVNDSTRRNRILFEKLGV